MQDPVRIEKSDPTSLLIPIIIGIVAGLFVFLLLLFLVEDVRLRTAELLGIAKHSDQLAIYDATCWREGTSTRLYLAYWSQEAAPLVVEFEDVTSPVITGEAGIQTIDLTFRDLEACPAEILLVDRSRDERSGSRVEIRGAE